MAKKPTDKELLDELESSIGMSSEIDRGRLSWELRQGPIRGNHYGKTARAALSAAIRAQRGGRRG